MTEQTMVVKVARAIYAVCPWWPGGDSTEIDPDKPLPYEDAPDYDRHICEEMARAAIEAMRDPTEAMEGAGDATFKWTSSDTNGSYYPRHADATECWQAMISEALK